MGTGISKIYGEMSEIIEPKVGNPQNSVGQEMSHFEPPLKPAFFEDEIFQFFFSTICPKNIWMKNCPYLIIKKAQNIRKNPKHKGFRGGLDWSAIKATPCMSIFKLSKRNLILTIVGHNMLNLNNGKIYYVMTNFPEQYNVCVHLKI